MEQRRIFINQKNELYRKTSSDYQKINRNKRFIDSNIYLLDEIKNVNEENVTQGSNKESIDNEDAASNTNEPIVTVEDDNFSLSNESMAEVQDNNSNTNLIDRHETVNLSCCNCKRKQNLDLVLSARWI